MIEYYIFDPIKQFYLGRNFCGWTRPLYAIGFGSAEAAMTHLLTHVAKYIEDYTFGRLEIVRASGQRRLVEIDSVTHEEYTGDWKVQSGHSSWTYYETAERIE